MAITSLSAIHVGEYVNRIRVRASRVWRPKQYKSEKYDGLHYLLIDEKGDSIHALVKENDYEQTDQMKEGYVYDCYHVRTRKALGHRVIDHDVELRFVEISKFIPVEESVCSIPKHAFTFMQFNELQQCMRVQSERMDHGINIILQDVYGCIKRVEFKQTNTMRQENKGEFFLEITLENLRRETIKITLWGDLAKNFNTEIVENAPPPVLAVFTSLRLVRYQDDITPTGTNHTCIIFNPDVQQAEEFRREFSKQGDKTKVIKELNTATPNSEIKTVLDLYKLNPQFDKDKIILCHATVVRFSKHSGWWYKRCPAQKCFKQLKNREDSGDYDCAEHKLQTTYIPWYKVMMTVKDNQDYTISFTLFGWQAEKFFGYSCLELLNKRQYQSEEDFPEEITNKVDQTYLFEVRMGRNDEMVVKNIHLDTDTANQSSEVHTESSGPSEVPISLTPEKTSERKRTAEPRAQPLLISEPEKKYQRQVRESTLCPTQKHTTRKDKQE